jgi:hypothetical protein
MHGIILQVNALGRTAEIEYPVQGLVYLKRLDNVMSDKSKILAPFEWLDILIGKSGL